MLHRHHTDVVPATRTNDPSGSLVRDARRRKYGTQIPTRGKL